MKISVFGLGYVGCVSAACLAQDGHTVVGVDVDERKVSAVAEGHAPFLEPALEELLSGARSRAALTATMNEAEAISATDMALVCVGTPSERTGAIKLDALRTVLTSIGIALREREAPFVVILRSTVMPNVAEGQLIPLLERASGKTLGDQLQFCYNPEFLREGTAIRDFYEAPIVVVGHNGSWAAQMVAELYSKVNSPIVYTDIATACLVKYACNAFHALKVSFANEIGHLSESLNVDGQRVMEIVCMDTKLNISPMYLKPGFAFGGSCLPKDLRAVVAESRHRGLPLPVIQNILPSNKAHLESCIDCVLNTGAKAIGLFGLTFKEGTDDLRESPAVEFAERLIGKGVDVTIYEPAISRETIHGTNLSFVERNIPHIWKLLTNNLETMVQEVQVIVVLKKMNEQERHILEELRADQVCMDLTGTIKLGEVKSQILKLGTPSSEVVLQ
ncbi:MAG TPA: nucleotide sugar dehydrogenase [Candidatus Acidoferrales bacterium]|jgi:GDP-mannose 6-dehydrogenase|nr:nucleotide sugar dehydrogenase [Candidatus Acidoferrales bacterium]